MSNLEPVLGSDDTIRRNFSKLEALYARTEALEAEPEDIRYISDTGQPAFTGTWVNNDAGTVPPSGTERPAFFYRHRGRVFLSGVIKSGVSGTSAFTLPTGYRPRESEIDLPVVASGGIARIAVTSAGVVVPTNVGATAVATFVFLDGVNFRHA